MTAQHPLAAYCRKSVWKQLPADTAQILSLTLDDLQRAGCTPAEIRRISAAQALAHGANAWTLSESVPSVNMASKVGAWIAKNLPHLRFSQQEELWIVIADTKLTVKTARLITRGTLDKSLAHPREFFRPAIESSAAVVFSVHNHPTGDVTPSHVDENCWTRLNAAGETLGIPAQDHFVVGRAKIYSRNENSIVFSAN